MGWFARYARSALFALATRAGFERTVRATPVGEAAAWRFARRYVAGTDPDAAITTAADLAARGIGASIDLFGEQVDEPTQADRAVDAYVELAERLGTLPEPVWLSADLSHLGLDVSMATCRAGLERIAAALPPGRLLQVGAEDSSRTDAVLTVVNAASLAEVPVMATLQVNLRRSPDDARRLADAGVPVRLVKGAYVEPPAVALPWGEPTDTAYLRLARLLRELSVPFTLATHDRDLRERVLSEIGPTGCELLLGVRNEDTEELVARGCPVRVYVQCGPDWFRYAMRRLAEARGA